MNCTLFIPHLLPPRELGDAFWRTVDAPQLKTLFSRAAFTADAATDTDALLCAAFGVAHQQDWPLAPVLAGSDGLRADTGYWLCATPVHLQAQRNALVLADPALLEISADESAAFAATLAQHLREENIVFHAPHPGRWYLQCEVAPAMATSSLGAVTGRDVRTFLPRGPDSARWRRILTEIQMLLHSHPINDAREADGRVAVNSVWLWAGGTLQPAAPATFDAVWSDDAIVRALAHHSGSHVDPQPDRVTPDSLQGAAHFFSFGSLEQHMRHGDFPAWSDAVTALNRDWFIPLIDAVRARRLGTLTLATSGEPGVRQFVLHRTDLLKFWRKNKYLE